MKLTLDNNCLIYLEPTSDVQVAAIRAPHADALRALIALLDAKLIRIAVPYVSLFEQTQDGTPQNTPEFRKRLEMLGLGNAEIISQETMAFDLGDGRAQYGPHLEIAFAQKMQDILFPNFPYFTLPEYITAYCARRGLERKDLDHITKQRLKAEWLNRKSDVMGLYIHLSWHGDIFVTNDGVFFQKTKRPQLLRLAPQLRILRPAEALAAVRETLAMMVPPADQYPEEG